MKPSKSLTKEELRQLHKAKMMGKHFRNLDPQYHKRGTYPAGKGVI